MFNAGVVQTLCLRCGRGSTMGPQTFLKKKRMIDILLFNCITKFA